MILFTPRCVSLLFTVLLLVASQAQAVLISSNQLLGRITPGTPANAANATEMVRFLAAALKTGTSGAVSYPGAGICLGNNPADPQPEIYTLWAPTGLNALTAPIPTSTGIQYSTSNTTLDLGTFRYDYILAKFGNDAVAFWIGNNSGSLTIPNLTGNKNGISCYTLIGKQVPTASVADGGTTISLLGAAFGGIALLRRKLS